jgi:CRP-like cAMP-binding protein
MTSSTDPIHQLLQSLEQTHGDIRAQAALTAEFLLMSRPEPERGPLRDSLDAATVLRWFDDDLLGEVLQIPGEEARSRSETLNTFSFVERYQRGEEEVRYIHEATRLGWRQKIARHDPDRLRNLSLRAASCFAADTSPAGRIEWIYHLLCGDGDLGASELQTLDMQWSTDARSEDRYALATALQELENTQLVQGRARAWCLLSIARIHAMRGEAVELVRIASEALTLAREVGDASAQVEAKWLEGEVQQSQGDLAAAQAALEESLAISRRLFEQDRESTIWQRGLAAALGKLGALFQVQGKPEAAQAAIEESQAIIQRAAEQDPRDVGWQRYLDIARGRMATIMQFGKSAVTRGPTYEEKRQIFQGHFLLGKLSASEIDDLLAYSRVERYPAGTEIYAKGSPGQSMFAVLRGTIKMSSVSPEGKEIVFNIVNPGDVFGEISLLDGAERSSDAVAMTDCQLLVLNRRDFMPILEQRADVLMILTRILCQRLRQTSEQVEDVLFRHLESRIAKALLHLAEATGLHGREGSPVDLQISQRELSNIALGSRESVNKVLQSWHRAGLITLGKGTIVIRDIAAIERLV